MSKKKPVQVDEPVAAVETLPEPEADEFDLPPNAFLYFLLAQASDDKMTQKTMEEKVSRYLRNRSPRDQDREIPSMLAFLGRLGSLTNVLSNFIYRR